MSIELDDMPLLKNLLIKDRNRRVIAECNGKNLD